MPTSNIPLEQRLKLISADGANALFEIERFGWIGTPVQEPQITWGLAHRASAHRRRSAQYPIRMGATTTSADNYLLPTILNQLLGTRMQVVTGYIGQNEIFLATERGEVQGNNTVFPTSPSTRRTGCGRQGPHPGAIRHRALPGLPNVPTAIELASAEMDRALLRSTPVKFSMARPLMSPPEVPPRTPRGVARRIRCNDEGPRNFLDEAQHRPRCQPLGGDGITS